MISTSVDKLVLDIATFLSLSIGGHAIQILCLRTLESEYTTLRLSVSILLCSALGVSTTLETYDLASILPHLVILFLGNGILIVCVHVIKRRAEKQLRREFIALCKEPLLATAAAGENREFQRRNSDVLSISGKVNDESVLCEVTARALRKLPQDRLKLLSCRNADVLLLGSIGQGNFGQVYRARYRGSMVAVKTFTFAKVGDIELEHFWHEAAISQRLQHPNILSFFGASISVPEKTAYCIIELGEGGTFDDVLSNPEYTWVNGRRNIIQGLSRAMCYLHSFLADIIVHHDLKPSNILISKTFEAKLSDFGVSISRPRHPGTAPESAQEQSHKEVESLDGPRANSPEIIKTSKKQSTVRGSPVYLAPEVHRGEAFSEKIDVYAFGLILCEALIGDGLYVVKSYNSLKGECWAEDANARPSFQMINQRFETLVEEEIEALTSAVSSTSQPGTSEIDGSSLVAVHAISELKADTNAEIESIEGADDEPISETSRSGKNLAVITQSPSAESLPSVVLASHQHGREVRVPSVVGLLQRGDTISSAMVPPMQRSPTGRSFSTFAFSAVGAAGQETGVFRELCSELQEELRQQSEMYECKLAEQKEKYEKQLASLAEALL
ncbi:Protein kinase, putative [Hondaea fermentalgiana]|uniref:Protein kinase, putative n=1 Tax=Hondaea fermentalgiana TaxID=2315210 RepID=A0A2R5G7Z5_9STRA|nr:Protein kinase, putative [Hondaea fermentalgiana]|eukprot:GBG27172.1 Protein kinase, putative [Hondaea fermentalgiana]